ncbi:MAG: hypothetical protein VKK97_11365 [Synechococcaceae cyanobacterium]|nr:hypothetical protein [Synechococcaceae cyanobacterium]
MIDVLGVSIGGEIARAWIQLLDGHRRIRRFISVGSPQPSTIAAHPWPRRLFRGIAAVKWGIAQPRQRNGHLSALRRIKHHSL